MGIAALVVCGSVNATSWRVCSKTEAGANFLTISEAVASNSVFAGDTLYVEPGHVEPGSDLHITKRLTIIGPGYHLVDNNINTMNPNDAVIVARIFINQDNVKIYGMNMQGTVEVSGDNVTIERCMMNETITVTGNSGDVIKQCLINSGGIAAYYSPISAIIENNIIYGGIYDSYGGPWKNSTIRNNTFIFADSRTCLVRNLEECNVYNNIVINTSTEYSTTTNPDQTIDTTWKKHFAIDAPASAGNTVRNNVISGKPDAEFLNCVFNAKVEDVLIWNGANTLEEKYKHKANGPAVGAGVNGTTCGAYGVVNGSQAYQPAGIPKYRPYIYDAQIDETPSSNNTINASFKIKVQQ